ncbi:MAG: DVU0150 family protein [Chloroflexota bacterium]
MCRLWKRLIGLFVMVLVFLPDAVLAAGGKAAPLVIVADTRRLTGWERWFAALYNESHGYFTLLTIVAIPLIGLLFGVIADLVMSRIGLDLKSRELAEH